MLPTLRLALVLAGLAGSVLPASAQRLPFERTFEVSAPATINITTDRGAIDIVSGEPGRIVITGTVTVRLGLTVPLDALALARNVAASPPVERRGDIFELGLPDGEAERRALTVAYQLRVPPETKIVSVTNSGATTVSGLSGETDLRTQSSAITGRSLKGRVRLRTQSGAVDAGFAGPGDADVETGSSALTIRRLDGGLTARTQSGRIVVDGTPTAPWDLSTGSSAMELMVRSPSFSLDAMSRSSDVEIEGAALQGSTSKGRARGTFGVGGPLVQADSRSGRIRVIVR